MYDLGVSCRLWRVADEVGGAGLDVGVTSVSSRIGLGQLGVVAEEADSLGKPHWLLSSSS